MNEASRMRELDFSRFQMRVPTECYSSPAHHERERELLWMRVWQIAGREDALPEPGVWMEYRIFDQSYVLVRGKDEIIRGFVNACRHRGNAICRGKGHTALITCPYHNWSYRLDGHLMAVPKPDFEGTVEEFIGANKEELGLVRVSVECFAGFIFLNPDRNARPLKEFLGEAADMMAPYHLEEMVPVGLNVRETIECNWKVVMDAFHEGYHVQGVHPELVPMVDLSKERFRTFGQHGATVVPFGGRQQGPSTLEQDVDVIRGLPAPNFPGIVDVLPRFEKLVASYRGGDGALNFPQGTTARTILQQATRETLTAKGMDVGGLTDSQMSDYQFWALFPNVYMQLLAGEATVIMAHPHPSGDPNRCVWHVAHYLWVPREKRAEKRTDVLEIKEGDHFPYFLALEQDYRQMERQQYGLRNKSLEYLVLTKQEPRVAHFHTVLNGWLSGNGRA
jgi:phenylpropionate dioxygenase-like ring-hydroxylating dioxygenase large terminal subunit